jgi:hypothetical protein
MISVKKLLLFLRTTTKLDPILEYRLLHHLRMINLKLISTIEVFRSQVQ